MSLFRLKATVNSYDWGKPASSSLVAQFGAKGSGIELDAGKRYSELWVGTHPNGPALVHDTGESLKDWLEKNPGALEESKAGAAAEATEGLSFLFKILSIDKALSIQAHPNQARAKQLFESRPDLYKDPNHKPEMACALTEFEALLGFESIERIVRHAEETPELVALLQATERGKAAWDALSTLAHKNENNDTASRKTALKNFFSSVLSADAVLVRDQVDALVARVQKTLHDEKRQLLEPNDLDALNALALRLHKDFPHDVGVFCAYIMCYRKLQAGEAVFLTSNEPHAYLSGECVEVMANSDNVIRAALTPKFKDLGELEQMLTYNEPDASEKEWHPSKILRGERRDAHTLCFFPPDAAVTEFQLERTKTTAKKRAYELVPSTYASVLFVTEGKGKFDSIEVSAGMAFFLPAGATVRITGGLVLYRVTKRGAVAV